MIEERCLTVLSNKQKCRINGKRGILKTVEVIEALPNGKQKSIHTDIHFKSTNATPPFLSLLKRNKRRAA